MLLLWFKRLLSNINNVYQNFLFDNLWTQELLHPLSPVNDRYNFATCSSYSYTWMFSVVTVSCFINLKTLIIEARQRLLETSLIRIKVKVLNENIFYFVIYVFCNKKRCSHKLLQRCLFYFMILNKCLLYGISL